MKDIYVDGKKVEPCKKVNLHQNMTIKDIDQLLLAKRKEIESKRLEEIEKEEVDISE